MNAQNYAELAAVKSAIGMPRDEGRQLVRSVVEWKTIQRNKEIKETVEETGVRSSFVRKISR